MGDEPKPMPARNGDSGIARDKTTSQRKTDREAKAEAIIIARESYRKARASK